MTTPDSLEEKTVTHSFPNTFKCRVQETATHTSRPRPPQNNDGFLKSSPGDQFYFRINNLFSTYSLLSTIPPIGFMSPTNLLFVSKQRDKRLTCSVVGHSLGQHGLPAAWRSVHEDPPGWVDTNLRNRTTDQLKTNKFSWLLNLCHIYS